MLKRMQSFIIAVLSSFLLFFNQAIFADDDTGSMYSTSEVIGASLLTAGAVGAIALLFQHHDNSNNPSPGPSPTPTTKFTWSKLGGPYASTTIYDLLVAGSSAKNASTTFAATLFGIYKSTDHGQSWQLSLPGYLIFSLAKDANGNIYAAGSASTNFGFTVLISKNNGVTWQAVLSQNKTLEEYTVPLFVDSQNIVYAGSPDGIYFSNDLGANWKKVPNITGYILGFAEDSGHTIYATVKIPVTNTNSKTSPSGQVWKLNGESAPTDLTSGEGDFPSPTQYVKHNIIAVPRSAQEKNPGPTGDILYVATTSGLAVYTGGVVKGGDWTKIFNGSEISSIVKDTGGNLYLGATAETQEKNSPYSGVYVCADGHDCTNIAGWGSPSLETTNSVTDFLFTSTASNSNNIYAASSSGVFYYNGTSWQSPDLTGKVFRRLAQDENTIYAGSDYFGVYYRNSSSTNAQLNWNSGESNMPTVSLILPPVLFGSNIYLFSDIPDYNLYISKDNGTTWGKNAGFGRAIVYDAAVTTTNATNTTSVYAVACELPTYNRVLRYTTNNGQSWQDFTGQNTERHVDFSVLATNTAQDTLFAGGTYSIFKNIESATTVLYWQKNGVWQHSADDALISHTPGIKSLAVDNNNSTETVFAGLDVAFGNSNNNYYTGILSSTDLVHWVNGYAEQEQVTDIIVDPTPTKHTAYALTNKFTENAYTVKYYLVYYNGSTWQKVYQFPKSPTHFTLNPQTGLLYYSTNFYVASANNGASLKDVSLGRGLFVSQDNGTTWTAISQFTNQQITEGLYDPATSYIYVSVTGVGVYVCKDGKTWELVNDGLSYLYVDVMSANTAGNIYAAINGDVMYVGAWVTKLHNFVQNAFMPKLTQNPVTTYKKRISPAMIARCSELQQLIADGSGNKNLQMEFEVCKKLLD